MPRPKRTVSDKQLAANRANAARSTGPRTPEGKARSAQNATKHGFAGSTFAVVRLEDLEEISDLKDDLVAVYQPINAQEIYAVERIAIAQQSIFRAARLESGLFTTALNDSISDEDRPIVTLHPDLVGDLEVTRVQNRNYALAEGFLRMVKHANTWTVFLRYQAQAERIYRRAVDDLERLIRLRDKLPNEPNSGPQPEAEPTTCAPPEPNPIRPEPGPPPIAACRPASMVHPRQEPPAAGDQAAPGCNALQQTREIAVCPGRHGVARGTEFENPQPAPPPPAGRERHEPELRTDFGHAQSVPLRGRVIPFALRCAF